jgi:O-antigen/teichoic acid export membrane protein
MPSGVPPGCSAARSRSCWHRYFMPRSQVVSSPISTAPLVLLLANAGIGSAAARASELSEYQARALTTVSLGLGVAAAGIVWLLAVPWSTLWGNPEAVDAIRWSALGVFPAPFLGLLMGLSRRSGKFRRLSVTSTVGGFIGMAVGAACVWHFRSAASLVTMSVVTTTLQTLLLLLVVGRGARPGPLRLDVVEHLRFGAKVVVANGIGYLTGTLPQLAISRGVGAAVLGSWNRATVTTQVPLEMIQSSLVQVIYPEFRHDIGTTKRSSRLWLDLLSLVAWVMIPLGAAAAACAYFALPVILGPGWQTSASLAPWIAMASVINMPVVILGSALEATGRFGGVWAPRILGLAVMVMSAILALVSHSVAPVIAGTYVGLFVTHAMQLRFVRRYAIFPVHMLLRVYLRVGLVAGGVGLVTTFWLSVISAVDNMIVKILLLAIGVTAAGTATWFARLHLPPTKIARRYGLFKSWG